MRGPAVIGYSLLMLIGSGLSFFKIFIVGRSLSPHEFGQYLYILLVIPYAVPLVALGIMDGLARRYPILLGRGEGEAAALLRNRCLGVLVLLVPSLAVFVWWGGTVFGKGDVELLGLACLQGVGLTAFSLGLRLLRSHLRLVAFSVFLFLRGALDVCSALALAAPFGVRGMLLAESVSLLLLSLFIFKAIPGSVRISFSGISQMRGMMREGGQIVFGGLFTSTALLGDRLILGMFLPSSEYAVYGFHLLVMSAALIVSNIVVQYLQPRLLLLFGETGDSAQVLRVMRRMMWRVGWISLLSLPFVFIAFSWLATLFFPGYQLDRSLLALALAAGIVQLTNQSPLALLTFRKLKTNLGIQVAASILVLGAVAWGLMQGQSLIYFGVILLSGRIFVWIWSFVAAHRVRDQEGVDLMGNRSGIQGNPGAEEQRD